MTRPVLILFVSALVMLGPFTNNIMVPSLPALATDLRIGFGDAQAILSIFMVGFAAGQLFVGPMSDRFGRKPVLTMSLALFIVASVLCAFAPDLCSLCAARLVQALGASATLSVGSATVSRRIKWRRFMPMSAPRWRLARLSGRYSAGSSKLRQTSAACLFSSLHSAA